MIKLRILICFATKQLCYTFIFLKGEEGDSSFSFKDLRLILWVKYISMIYDKPEWVTLWRIRQSFPFCASATCRQCLPGFQRGRTLRSAVTRLCRRGLRFQKGSNLPCQGHKNKQTNKNIDKAYAEVQHSRWSFLPSP